MCPCERDISLKGSWTYVWEFDRIQGFKCIELVGKSWHFFLCKHLKLYHYHWLKQKQSSGFSSSREEAVIADISNIFCLCPYPAMCRSLPPNILWALPLVVLVFVLQTSIPALVTYSYHRWRHRLHPIVSAAEKPESRCSFIRRLRLFKCFCKKTWHATPAGLTHSAPSKLVEF